MKLHEIFDVVKSSDVVIEDCHSECLFSASPDESYESLVSICKPFLDCDVVDVCAGLSFGRDDFPSGCVVIAINP